MHCEACNYVTTDNSNWKRHCESKRHFSQKPKSFSCERCMYETKIKANFERHCASEMHLAKQKAKRDFDFLDPESFSQIVSENVHRLECIKVRLSSLLLKNNACFMHGKTVNYFKKGKWNTTDLDDFVGRCEEALNSEICTYDHPELSESKMNELYSDGSTEDGAVTKMNCFWWKRQLVKTYISLKSN